MRPELVDPLNPRHWTPGELIGRYTLLARIAIGGMAEIWLARQMGLKGFEKVVVIKRISDNYSADPVFVDMFLDEARIAAQLDHPNIVQIHDLGQHANAFYIAMEYLHGEDLAHAVRTAAKVGEPLPHAYAAYIVGQAAEGLASAHQKSGLDGKPLGVVHRDVSPQNIFVTYEGGVKMLDFGVAKAANRASSTSGGQLKGKFGYMSPEHARGEEIDGRADVWSLGVVLFETVTLTRLFDPKQDPMKLLKQVSSDDPVPSARSRNGEVPAELDAIIARALQRNVKQRFQSAHELRSAIDKWLRTHPGAPTTIDIAMYMRKLFAERLGRKSALIESARSGEIEFFRVPEALKPDSERSMPGDTVLVTGHKPMPRSRRPVLVAAGGGALLALGLVLAMVQRVITNDVVPASLEISTQPAGARLEIDGTPAGVAPYHTDELAPGKHVVMAFLDGKPEQAKAVTLVAGELVEVKLQFPESGGPKIEQAEPGLGLSLSDPAPKVEAPAKADPPPRADAAQKADPSPKAVAKGKLSVETNPWTQVYLGARKLGETPLIGVALPVGKHKLKLVNEEKKLTRYVEVQIEAGKTTVKQLDLTK